MLSDDALAVVVVSVAAVIAHYLYPPPWLKRLYGEMRDQSMTLLREEARSFVARLDSPEGRAWVEDRIAASGLVLMDALAERVKTLKKKAEESGEEVPTAVGLLDCILSQVVGEEYGPLAARAVRATVQAASKVRQKGVGQGSGDGFT